MPSELQQKDTAEFLDLEALVTVTDSMGIKGMLRVVGETLTLAVGVSWVIAETVGQCTAELLMHLL